MAIVYKGECQRVTPYIGDVALSNGTVSGYIKSIEVNYTAVDNDVKNKNGAACFALCKVNIDLKEPSVMDKEDFVSYNDLDSTWAQTLIDNYLDDSSGSVKKYLDKELKKQYPPFVGDIEEVPWG